MQMMEEEEDSDADLEEEEEFDDGEEEEDEEEMDQLYGCGKCRYAHGGCAQCRETPLFQRPKGLRWQPEAARAQTVSKGQSLRVLVSCVLATCMCEMPSCSCACQQVQGPLHR